MALPEAVCKAAHVAFGLLSATSSVISPVLTAVSFALFLVYELNEEWHLSDRAYEELAEFGIGFAIGIIVLQVLKYLGCPP